MDRSVRGSRSAAVLARLRPAPVAVVAGEGAVWVLNADSPSLTRIDPRDATVKATIPLGVGSNPTAIAIGAGAVWVALTGDGAIARLDARSDDVEKIDVGGAPTGVAVAQRRIWISVQPGFRTGQRVRARAVRVPGAIDEPFCTPVEFAAQGAPDFLIASDFPLQVAINNLQPLQFTDAVRFMLARRGFRAGRYRVGYQSCDDSTVQISQATESPWTPATCRRSGRTYSDATKVLGVIGPYHSGCASFLIPGLGRARDGPLALISGSATALGLTRGGPGAQQGEPQRYYPTGTRNFARVVAADHVQGAAAVVTAKRTGVKRLFVLDDAEPYGIGLATTVRRAAGSVGIVVAGSGTWRYPPRDYRRLARRIARSGADGVFLGGYGFLAGGKLLRDLRSILGRRVELLAPDGFSEFRDVVQRAGAAAEGLVVSVAGPPVDGLPASGRRFARAFEDAIGGSADPYSITTAQATDVLLDAIAASDGTRASVTEELLKVRVRNGLLGSFRFDANGDMTAPAVTMYRIEQGKPRVRAVVTPPASLLR